MQEKPISSFLTGCHNETRCKGSQSAALLQELAVKLDARAANEQLCYRMSRLLDDGKQNLRGLGGSGSNGFLLKCKHGCEILIHQSLCKYVCTWYVGLCRWGLVSLKRSLLLWYKSFGKPSDICGCTTWSAELLYKTQFWKISGHPWNI